jgi:hypothetical protein
MAVYHHVYCRVDLTSHRRNPILYEMILDHLSVSPLLCHYLVTSCQIVNRFRELSVSHSVTFRSRLDIDVWEIDLLRYSRCALQLEGRNLY